MEGIIGTATLWRLRYQRKRYNFTMHMELITTKTTNRIVAYKEEIYMDERIEWGFVCIMFFF